MKILIIIALIIYGLTGYAQTFTYKAVQFVCTRYQNQPLEPPEFKDCNGFPIDFDIDSSTLNIHSPNGQFFRMIVIPGSYKETDSITEVKFNAMDKKGAKCRISVELYPRDKSKHDGCFWLEYPDKIYMYFVEKG